MPPWPRNGNFGAATARPLFRPKFAGRLSGAFHQWMERERRAMVDSSRSAFGAPISRTRHSAALQWSRLRLVMLPCLAGRTGQAGRSKRYTPMWARTSSSLAEGSSIARTACLSFTAIGSRCAIISATRPGSWSCRSGGQICGTTISLAAA